MGRICNCKIPEFGGKKVFSHVVSGHVTDVTPVYFTESILVLTARRSTADGGVRLEKIIDGSADQFEISIGNHFARVAAEFSNELF